MQRAFSLFFVIALLLDLVLSIGSVWPVLAATASRHHNQPFFTSPVLQLQAGPCRPNQFLTQAICDFTIIAGNVGNVPTVGTATVTDTPLTGGGQVQLLEGAGCGPQSGISARCEMNGLVPGHSWQMDVTVTVPWAQAALAHCRIEDRATLKLDGGKTLSSTAIDVVSGNFGVCKLPQPNGATHARLPLIPDYVAPRTPIRPPMRPLLLPPPPSGGQLR